MSCIRFLEKTGSDVGVGVCCRACQKHYRPGYMEASHWIELIEALVQLRQKLVFREKLDSVLTCQERVK